MKRKILYLMLMTIVLVGCDAGKETSADNTDSYGSFTLEKTYSFDDKYYAIQEAVEDKASGSRDIVVSIYMAENEELAGTFHAARARDFWGICWESDTYNIWIQSADIGIICYKFEDGQWIQDDSAERPDDIISKYDD